MTNVPTQWATTTQLNPTLVAPVVANQSGWNSTSTPLPTQYAPIAQNDDSWGHTPASQTYYFDDRFTYDDPLTMFDGLINTNTVNQLGQTSWSKA